jgi:hypothetical protein
VRLFAPEIDMAALGPRRVPPAHHAFRGEVSRIVLETLRTAAGPLSTTEITRRVMEGRGLDTNDVALARSDHEPTRRRLPQSLETCAGRRAIDAGAGTGVFVGGCALASGG